MTWVFILALLAYALGALSGALALAVTGGLAAACFIKVGGAALLGRPRTAAAAKAEEVPAAMYVPPLALAGLCLVLGVLPGPVAGILAGSVRRSLNLAPGIPWPSAHAASLALPWGGSSVAPGLFAAAALAVGLAVAAVRSAGRRRVATEWRTAWACGGEAGVAGQYSATAYAKSFREVFRPVYRPTRAVSVEAAVHPFFRVRVRYEGAITPVFDRYLYAPALGGLLALAAHGRRLQSGSLRLYLAYILVSLLLLLAFVR